MIKTLCIISLLFALICAIGFYLTSQTTATTISVIILVFSFIGLVNESKKGQWE